jgi:hypothetical protein
MRSLLCLVLMVVGLLLLATPGLPAGLLLMYVAYRLFNGVTPAAEERFTAALMILGGLGAAAVFVTFLVQRLA